MAEKIEPKKTKRTSKESLEQYLRRAIRAVGELSLLTSDISLIQAAIDLAYPDQRQRQLVTYMNSLLSSIGRKEKLQPLTKAARDVRYLPLTKLGMLLEHLPNRAWQVLVEMAFYTGLRIGELFALTEQSRMREGLRVDFQITRDGGR